MKKMFDISLTLSPRLPVWDGDPRVFLQRVSKIEDGFDANVTELRMRVHSGTHIDAPCHFINGAMSVEQIPLDVLIGRAQVIEIPEECDLITAGVLQSANLFPGIERVLFKTRNSKLWEKDLDDFQKEFVALDPESAQILVEKNIRLVGVDYLSVAPFIGGAVTHRVLLGAGIIALEGLNLLDVPAGTYNLYCLPLKILGSDGAPARVILIEE